MLTQLFTITGPCPAATRILPDLEAEEDCPACLRRLSVRQLRAGSDRAGLLDRGAEDCQEGAEGAGPGREEEQISCRGHQNKRWHSDSLEFPTGLGFILLGVYRITAASA